MAKLYLVGTPIGNLGDFSSRGIKTLEEVDFIAAEDTRVSRKLTTHFGISKPMVSFHEHNAKEAGQQILSRMQQGENCALLTDAGMPCISDPGELLVRLCQEQQIEVVAVPGPTAVITALCLSGLSAKRFSFEGFLSPTQEERLNQLYALRLQTQTLIFYEAPHRLLETLHDMLDVFGDRKISVCRELTKLHEEVLPIILSQAVEYFQNNPPRGEFVLVVEGATLEQVQTKVELEEAVQMTLQLAQQGISLSQAAKDVARATQLPKGELYRKAIQFREEQSEK